MRYPTQELRIGAPFRASRSTPEVVVTASVPTVSSAASGVTDDDVVGAEEPLVGDAVPVEMLGSTDSIAGSSETLTTQLPTV